MFGGKKQSMSSLYEDLHACSDCGDCRHYKLERDFLAYSAYCYHPLNWHKIECATTASTETFESFSCIKGPNEINVNGQCEWRDDGCDSFSVDIIDQSSEREI